MAFVVRHGENPVAVHPLAYVVRFVPQLVQRWTLDLTDEEWPKRPRKELHSAQWILGHLVVTLARAAGAAARLPSWSGEFRPDAPPSEEQPPLWPHIGQLRKALAAQAEHVAKLWTERTEEEWGAPPEDPGKSGAKTVLEAAAFTLLYLSAHAGQLEILRRLLRKEESPLSHG